MNAVGIDISKGKSMVCAMCPPGQVIIAPREYPHTKSGLEQMAYAIKALEGETRVVMEATGRYHEPVASALHEVGIFVSVVNPKLIHDYGNNSLRKTKTDKKDARKIARYALEYWADLREYTP